MHNQKVKYMPEVKKKLTYYEMVDSIYSELDKIYDRVGGLRDAAEGREKDIFNDTRGQLGPLINGWRRFRDNLPEDRANVPIGNWKK
jgi:hypothetical protein